MLASTNIIIGCSIGTPVLVVVVLVTGAGGPDILLEEGIPKEILMCKAWTLSGIVTCTVAVVIKNRVI